MTETEVIKKLKAGKIGILMDIATPESDLKISVILKAAFLKSTRLGNWRPEGSDMINQIFYPVLYWIPSKKPPHDREVSNWYCNTNSLDPSFLYQTMVKDYIKIVPYSDIVFSNG